MPRTTLNLDPVVFKELNKLRRLEGKTLGRLVSELLAESLVDKKGSARKQSFKWQSRPMGARIDLEDKEALNALLDRS